MSASIQHPLSMTLLAEASSQIGTGHVVETFSLANVAQERDILVEIWLNKETPQGLYTSASCPVRVIDNFSTENLEQIRKSLPQKQRHLVVTNFRRITNLQIAALRQDGERRIACIDELGDVKLDCDLVVNPSPVTDYHRYRSDNPRFKLVVGPQYISLAKEYQALHRHPRKFEGPIQNIVITMGGTDRSGATLKIVKSLLDWRSNVTKHVVVGSGFSHTRELGAILNQADETGFVVHRGLSSLANLLSQCDVGFTAGGNTLCEMACVGTPALILYEDPHEREQTLAFQAQGFGICLGSGLNTKKEQIWEALNTLEAPEQREAFCRTGRVLVDGRGTERILASMLELVDDVNFSVQT